MAALQETARARMFRAAFQSASAENPQCRHRNTAWLSRLAFSQFPHSEQVRDVLRGSTCTTGIPASCALYERKLKSWWNDQPESLLRASPPRAVIRPCIPLRSSRAIPQPVSLAVWTIDFEMQWFSWRRNWASLPEIRLSFFLVPLVPFR